MPIARMCEMRNACKILVGHLQDVDVDGRIVLI
jgi:hypothetical protein